MVCPNCGKTELQHVVIPSYSTRMQGVPVQVDNAEIRVCRECGEEVVSAKELKRWRDTQRRQLSETGCIPKPAEIRELRERIPMSQKDFAALLGVTRQTVSAWEREGGWALQFGPASLLLGLLKAHLNGQDVAVLPYLLTAANERGQRISPKATEELTVSAEPAAHRKPTPAATG
jgi:putative zinc finger/helix-turn-helix YgiT family protein